MWWVVIETIMNVFYGQNKIIHISEPFNILYMLISVHYIGRYLEQGWPPRRNTCRLTAYPVNLCNIKLQTYFRETCSDIALGDSWWKVILINAWSVRQKCYSTIDYTRKSTIYYNNIYI